MPQFTRHSCPKQTYRFTLILVKAAGYSVWLSSISTSLGAKRHLTHLKMRLPMRTRISDLLLNSDTWMFHGGHQWNVRAPSRAKHALRGMGIKSTDVASG